MNRDQGVDQWRKREAMSAADENRQRDQKGDDFQEPCQSVVRSDKRPPEHQHRHDEQETRVWLLHGELLLILSYIAQT